MTLKTLLLLTFGVVSASAETIKLTIPDAPPVGTQTLDGSYQGYSMEVASFADIAGDLSYVSPRVEES